MYRFFWIFQSNLRMTKIKSFEKNSEKKFFHFIILHVFLTSITARPWNIIEINIVFFLIQTVPSVFTLYIMTQTFRHYLLQLCQGSLDVFLLSSYLAMVYEYSFTLLHLWCLLLV